MNTNISYQYPDTRSRPGLVRRAGRGSWRLLRSLFAWLLKGGSSGNIYL